MLKPGQLKWKAASPEPANIFALPTICGDTLYIGDFYGSMVWLSAFTGNRRMIALFVSMTSVIPAPELRATRTQPIRERLPTIRELTAPRRRRRHFTYSG